MERDAKTKDIWSVAIIFVAGVLIHFYLANFAKILTSYGDEMMYYYAPARSFFKGNGFMRYRGVFCNFQKIGYSLLLSPLFAIGNGILRIRFIALLNSVVMMSSIIPAWLIGKELGLNRKNRCYLSIVTAIWPDMMLSMTFMAEVLYWPIFLLFVYSWIVNNQRQSLKIAIIEGLLCYLGYLTKEIFLALPLACFCFEILSPLFTRSRYEKKRFARLGVMTAVLTSCHIAMKLTVFKGLGGTYDEVVGLQAFLSSYHFAYTVYAALYYCAASLAVVLVIPFAYPAAHFKSMEAESRKLFCWSILFFLIAAATIAFTISVREELGNAAIKRMNLRYLGPAFIPVVAVFLSCVWKTASDALSKRSRRGLEFIILGIIIMCVMYKGSGPGSHVDHQTLMWYEKLVMAIGVLLPPSGEQIFYIGAYLANLIIASLFLIFILIRNKRLAAIYFMLALAVMCVVDDACVYHYVYNGYRADESILNDVLSMNNYFKNNERVLYLTGQPGQYVSVPARYMDTYMDRDLYFVDETFLTKGNEGNAIIVADAELRECIENRLYPKVAGIDYIILENGRSRAWLDNVEPVAGISGKTYTVYRNLDPAVIRGSYGKILTYSPSVLAYTGETKILDDGRAVIENGTHQYGPHVHMSPGKYTVTFEGDNLSNVEIHVPSWKLEQMGCPPKFEVMHQGEDRIVLSLLVEESVDDIDYQLFNNTGETVFLSRIIVEHLGD